MADRMEERLRRMGAKEGGPNTKQAVEGLIAGGLGGGNRFGAGGAPRTQSALDSQRLFNDRRSPNPTDIHFREGVEHGVTGAEYKGYGGRSRAINYGEGYREGVNQRITGAVESKAPCPSPGCGKKHRSPDAAVKAHRNSPFPNG